MKTVDLISELESTSSLNDKKALLEKAFQSGNREFFVGAKLAYNKLVSLGVKKIPAIAENEEGGDLPFVDFIQLVNRLRRREITGHAARDAIIAAAEVSDRQVWNTFYRRILLRDLKINVGASLINTVLKELGKSDREALEYIVPVFECQLAEDSKKHPKKLSGKKLIDIKLDGARMLTVLDIESKTVRMFTRNGIETDRFPHISSALEGMLSELPMSVVLDGEILSDTFQGLMSQFQRKDADTKDMKLGLFDIIPLVDFQKGKCLIAQEKRHESLVDLQTSGLLQKYTGDKVYVIPKMTVDLSTQEGRDAMRAFFDEAILAGFEGIMIKDPSAGYEGRKYSAWLKWKPVETFDLTVIGMENGDPETKYENVLGAMICKGTDNGRLIRVNVGSGFSDEQRTEFWNERHNIIGQIVEIIADAVSQAKSGEYSLRFPRFVRFRSLTLEKGIKD